MPVSRNNLSPMRLTETLCPANTDTPSSAYTSWSLSRSPINFHANLSHSTDTTLIPKSERLSRNSDTLRLRGARWTVASCTLENISFMRRYHCYALFHPTKRTSKVQCFCMISRKAGYIVTPYPVQYGPTNLIWSLYKGTWSVQRLDKCLLVYHYG